VIITKLLGVYFYKVVLIMIHFYSLTLFVDESSGDAMPQSTSMQSMLVRVGSVADDAFHNGMSLQSSI